MIPPVSQESGLLPEGAWRATLAEVEQEFVKGAPNPADRGRVFAALVMWLSLAREVFGPGLAWIDGGFTTLKLASPHDVDLVYFPDDLERASAALMSDERAFALLTLQDVMFMAPGSGGHSPRVQPMGSLVDAFLGSPRLQDDVNSWFRLWSCVKGPDGTIVEGITKGFVEVSV